MRSGEDLPGVSGEPRGQASGAPPGRRGWRRLVKPVRVGVLLCVIALVAEYLVVPELVGASRDLYLLGQISGWWVAAGLVLEVVALFCYAVLTRVLLPPGPKPGLYTLFRIDLSAAAVAHVIPAGTLGTAALGFRLFTAEGIPPKNATVMMAAKGIGSTVVINVLLWLSLVISIPLAGFKAIYGPVAIIGTVLLLGLALLVLGVTRGAGIASRLLHRVGDKIPFLSGEKIEKAVLDGARDFALLARDKKVMAWALLWASLNWLLDAASLWCFVAAFGRFINPVLLFAAYGIANVAGALPITPGGLGVVDSILPLLLVGFGVTRSVATLGVLGWRTVNFWLPIPTGAAAFVSLKVKPGTQRREWRAFRAGLAGMFSGHTSDAARAVGRESPEQREQVVAEALRESQGAGDPAGRESGSAADGARPADDSAPGLPGNGFSGPAGSGPAGSGPAVPGRATEVPPADGAAPVR